MSLDKFYIKNLIQLILDKNHSEFSKKIIKEYPDKFNFACPICGDSEKVSSKKRGNLYFKNMMYICYNESHCNRSFTKFLDTFNIQMDIEKKLEMYDYIEKNIQLPNNSDVAITSLDKLIDINELMNFYSVDKTRGLTNLKPMDKNGPVYYYVKNIRKISNTNDIFEGIYNFSDKWKQPVMVFLNRSGDKVLSLQIRNLLEGDKRYFKILDFTYIYDMMYPDDKLDEQERISYNKLSHFFNIFKIDFSSTINMFEGYTDSLFLPNSIGQIGINTDISFLLNEDGLDIRFIYDNDKTGFRKTEKMIDDGHNVFLWNKFFIDLIKKNKSDRFKMAKLLSENIKDFNKLAIKINKPIYNMFNWDNYFSNNSLDKLYLMNLNDLVKMNL